MEAETIIIEYISVWNWYLLGWLFFLGAIVSILIDQGFGVIAFSAFMLGCLISWVTTFYKKNKLLKGDQKDE